MFKEMVYVAVLELKIFYLVILVFEIEAWGLGCQESDRSVSFKQRL